MPTKRCCCPGECFCFAIPTSCAKLCAKVLSKPVFGTICEAGALSLDDLEVSIGGNEESFCEKEGEVEGEVNLHVTNSTGDIYYAKPYGPPIPPSLDDTYYGASIYMSLPSNLLPNGMPDPVPDYWEPPGVFSVDGGGAITGFNQGAIGEDELWTLQWYRELASGASFDASVPVIFDGCDPEDGFSVGGGIDQETGGTHEQPAGCKRGWSVGAYYRCIRECDCTQNQEDLDTDSIPGNEEFRPLIGNSVHPTIPTPLMVCNKQNMLVRSAIPNSHNRKRCTFGIRLPKRYEDEIAEDIFPLTTLVITTECSNIKVNDFKIATGPNTGNRPIYTVIGNNTKEVTVEFPSNYTEYVNFCLELTQTASPDLGHGCCEELILEITTPYEGSGDPEDHERWSKLVYPKQECLTLFPCVAGEYDCDAPLYSSSENCADYNTEQCDDPP